MTSTTLVLAGVALLAVAATVIFAVLVAGIRRGDRGHLASKPDSPSSAFARLILVGVRYPSRTEGGEGQ